MSQTARESDGLRTNGTAEIRLKAKSVSRGVAIGRAVCLFGTDRQYYRVGLGSDEIPAEIRRFRAAVRLSSRQLKKLADAEASRTSASGQGIFETHLVMLQDPSFLSKVEGAIEQRRINAEWAIKIVTDEYVAKFKQIDDEHFRDRFVDLVDVSQRITNALGGGPRSKVRLESDAVIIARELRPSTMFELYEGSPIGLVTERGGWTSHSFIMAREMNTPAVTGIKEILRRVETGDSVIVDGFEGVVILNPSPRTVEKYRSVADRAPDPDNFAEIAGAAGPVKTLDGREITIRANADLPAVYRRSKQFGVKGIGLFRSEFLFNRFGGFPTEHQQFEAYRRLAAVVGDDGVKIRTFDIGVGQLLDSPGDQERNPALGLRGIRLGLLLKRELRTQIRAILRAAHGNAVDIVVPMVTSASELQDVRSLVKEEKRRLEKAGSDYGDPKIGAMIEVPSAVLTADAIFRAADFVCLGTNDLIQYLLAVDRDNDTVANWYRTLHPAVIAAIKTVISAAARAEKPLIFCGEMAASPFYVPILIGLGATDFSMNLTAVGKVRRVISGVAFDEARKLTSDIEGLDTPEEIEAAVRSAIAKSWSHLYPADFLDARRF